MEQYVDSMSLPLDLQMFADEDDKGGQWDNDDDAGKDGKDKKLSNQRQQQRQGEKSFTQSEVNKMMTKEKAQGRKAGLSELGIDADDAKLIQDVKDFMASRKSDVDIANEKLVERTAALVEIERRMLFAEAKAEAMLQGVKAQYVDDAVTLVMGKATADESDFTTMIGELKTKYPTWFGEDDDDKKDKGAKGKDGKDKDAGKKGTGSSMKADDKDNKGDEQTLGQRLAAQRKQGVAKTSYWGVKK